MKLEEFYDYMEGYDYEIDSDSEYELEYRIEPVELDKNFKNIFSRNSKEQVLKMMEKSNFDAEKILKEEEKENLCQVFEIPGFKIIIHPSGKYKCSFDTLDELIEEQLKVSAKITISDMIFSLKRYKISSYNRDLNYISDKKLFELINKIIKNKIKNKLTRESFAFAHIYGELQKKGYQIPRLTNYSAEEDAEIDLYSLYEQWRDNVLLSNIRLKRSDNRDYEFGNVIPMLYFDKPFGYLEPMFGHSIYNNRDPETQIIIKYLYTFIGYIFDKKEKEKFQNYFENYNERFLDMCKKYIKDYDDILYNLFVQTYKVAILNGESIYIKQICNNVNMNFSLKGAYNILSDEDKDKIYKELYEMKKEDKFTKTIIDIFQKKCRKKDGKTYDLEEIKNFLREVSYTHKCEKEELNIYLLDSNLSVPEENSLIIDSDKRKRR